MSTSTATSSALGTFFSRLYNQALAQAESPALASGGNGLATNPGGGITQASPALTGLKNAIFGGSFPNLALGAGGILLIVLGGWGMTR